MGFVIHAYTLFTLGGKICLFFPSGEHTSDSEFVNLVDLCISPALLLIFMKHCKVGVLRSLILTRYSSIFIVTF